MRSLSPQTWLLLATLLYGLLAMVATLSAVNVPWLGVQFEAEPRIGGVKVAGLHPDGPAAGKLLHGEQVYWVAGGELPPLPLVAGDLLEDPDLAPDYGGYRAFLDRQNTLHQRLRQPEVTLGLGEDRQVTLRPAASRPLNSLPPKFWFQLLCAMVGLLVAAAVWGFGRRNIVTTWFLVSGMGLLLTVLPAMLYTSRELALDGAFIRRLSIFNHLGGAAFVAGLVGLIWNYPVRIARFRADLVAAAAMLLIWAVDTAQVMETVSQGYWYPLLGVGLAGFGMGIVQWRLARGNPASHAIINWLLLAGIIGPGAYTALFLVPIFLDTPPVVSQATSWGFLTLFFVMASLGITRYRLFDLETVWYKAWGWFLGGACVILTDLLLVYVFGVGSQPALVLALFIVGFLYFPLRQWIWRLLPWQPREQNLLELLPNLLSLALNARSGPTESGWHLALYQVFEPLEIQALREPVNEVELLKDNLALRIPGFEGCSAVELYCARRGGRLFNARDVEFATALRLLFEWAVVSRKALHRGAYIERTRIARDLHDDIGAMLLSVVYQSPVPEVSDMAREALAKLRTVIRSLEVDERCLSEVLPEWRRETKERCDAANIGLQWRQDALPRDPLLNPRQQINLWRLIQEAISNVIKHARARSIEALFSFDDDKLRVTVSDDGAGLGNNRAEGSGMNNMRRRARELGGDIRWEAAAGGGCRVIWTVPFPQEPAGA